MKIFKIGEKEYKVQYGYNTFCDTDLMDRVQDMTTIFSEGNPDMGKVRSLFVVSRELFFVGLQKHNPVESVQVAGDLLDQYNAEAPEGESRNMMDIFNALTSELTEEGFLSGMMNDQKETQIKKKAR